LVLPTAGNKKLLLWTRLQWHDLHSKFHLPPFIRSRVIKCVQMDIRMMTFSEALCTCAEDHRVIIALPHKFEHPSRWYYRL
jgi:hypothetical protein